jgi:cell division protein FtsN
MAVERFGSKTDVVVKLILVFFISLLSFSIGTFVGKKFSDNQHKISQLEPGAVDKEDSSHQARTTASATDDDSEGNSLSDAEISKLAEEFVTDDEKTTRSISSEKTEKDEHHAEKTEPEHAAKKEEPKTEPKAEEHKAAEHKPEHKADQVGAVAQKVAEGKSPAEGEKHVEKKAGPVTVLPKNVAASAAGKFTVQVASYPKEDEAQGMASELKNKGFSAFYIPAQIKGQTWYRVSVGLFTTQKEAQAYRDDLLSRAKVSSAIVQKITQ